MWDNHQALRWLANALFALVALLVIFNIGAWAVNSPVFPLKELSVRGVHGVSGVSGKLTHVTREQIESAVHGKVTGNFFTVDLDATRQAFESCRGCAPPVYGGIGRSGWKCSWRSMWRWRVGAILRW